MDAFSEMHIGEDRHIAKDRFADYVDELRRFSQTHQVPCGKAEDLPELIKALKSSPAFDADFGSMIRSIVLCEHFKPSESELLTLIAVAWGGEHAGDSVDDLPTLLGELRSILQDLLRRGSMGRYTPRPAPQEQEAVDTIQDLEQGSPDVAADGQLVKGQSSDFALEPTIVALGGTVESEPMVRGQLRPIPQMASMFLLGRKVEEESAPRRPEPSLSEIVAMGLTGLVVALLFSVGSRPVYRFRVSVDLSAGSLDATDPGGGGGLLAGELRSGGLTAEAAQRLLSQNPANPILRQDTLSRGMRFLHAGGDQTIPYADLVAETAHQVRVRRLGQGDAYEISCDSWSSAFAVTFCRELRNVLQEQAGGDSIQTIETATRPTAQIYPHWYLQGVAGLAVGCLIGVLAGFVKRPKANGGDEESAES